MRYTFDVSKCDLLFDLLLRGGVIRLTEEHVIPNADILAKKIYCKGHDSYTHTTGTILILIPLTNAIIFSDRYNQWSMMADWTLGDGGKMKLNIDPFPIGMVELTDKRILVCTDQVADELRNRMIRPHNPETGLWKENVVKVS
jgi:hypothetical protein